MALLSVDGDDGYYDDEIEEKIEYALDEYYCDKKLDVYRTLSKDVKNQKGSLLMIFEEVGFLEINKSSKKMKILLIIDICFIIIYQIVSSILLILSGCGYNLSSECVVFLMIGGFFEILEKFIVSFMSLFDEVDEIKYYNNSNITNIYYFYNECAINKEEFKTFYGEILDLKFYHLSGIVTFFINLFFILVIVILSLLLSELLYLIFGKICKFQIVKDNRFTEAIFQYICFWFQIVIIGLLACICHWYPVYKLGILC